MPSLSFDSRDAAHAAASKRTKRTTTVTHVASTATATVAASFLRELQVGDAIRFSAVTSGGSTIDQDADYYILTIPSATTFTFSATPGGAPHVSGSNIVTGNVNTGTLTASEHGYTSNYVSPNSVAGR